MLKGNISNKPALSIVVLLDDIAEKVSYNITKKKVKITVASRQQIQFFNKLFLSKDIRIIVVCFMDKKYKEQVEEQLDQYRLLFSETVFVNDVSGLAKFLRDNDITAYTDNANILDRNSIVRMSELTIGY